MKQKGIVCWVIALKTEAGPLIRHYGLKKVNRQGDYSVYHDEERLHWLIITGIGKENSTAATDYLYQIAGEPRGAAWINVGIAGHRERELGELRWVNRLEDAVTGMIWYPPRVLRAGSGQAGALLTVNKPGNYPEGDTLVDMEASGFYPVACQYSSRELVQIVKLVSDNENSSWRDLDRGAVEGWMEDQLDDIIAGSDELALLSGQERELHAEPDNYRDILAAWHFTATEKHQLKKALRRYDVLKSGNCSALEDCRESGVGSGSEALATLSGILSETWTEAVSEKRRDPTG